MSIATLILQTARRLPDKPAITDANGTLTYAAFAERSAAARAEGAVLRYVATVTPDGPLAVGVRPVPAESVLGSRKGPENVVVIRTRRYDAHPLTIVGPGAGAAVTAAGMLGDAISLALGRRG